MQIKKTLKNIKHNKDTDYIVFGELTSIHQLNVFKCAGLCSLEPIHNHVFITNVPPMTTFLGGYVR